MCKEQRAAQIGCRYDHTRQDVRRHWDRRKSLCSNQHWVELANPIKEHQTSLIKGQLLCSHLHWGKPTDLGEKELRAEPCAAQVPCLQRWQHVWFTAGLTSKCVWHWFLPAPCCLRDRRPEEAYKSTHTRMLWHVNVWISGERQWEPHKYCSSWENDCSELWSPESLRLSQASLHFSMLQSSNCSLLGCLDEKLGNMESKVLTCMIHEGDADPISSQDRPPGIPRRYCADTLFSDWREVVTSVLLSEHAKKWKGDWTTLSSSCCAPLCSLGFYISDGLSHKDSHPFTSNTLTLWQEPWLIPPPVQLRGTV